MFGTGEKIPHRKQKKRQRNTLPFHPLCVYEVPMMGFIEGCSKQYDVYAPVCFFLK